MQQPRLPLILGGKGGPRSLRLAAALADEYNTVMSTAEEIADVRKRLDEACEASDRDPTTLPLSMMTGWLVGADREPNCATAPRRLARVERRGRRRRRVPGRAAREHDHRHRTDEAIEQLRELEAAGLTRIMGQHLLHRDLDAIELMGTEIAPALA